MPTKTASYWLLWVEPEARARVDAIPRPCNSSLLKYQLRWNITILKCLARGKSFCSHFGILINPLTSGDYMIVDLYDGEWHATCSPAAITWTMVEYLAAGAYGILIRFHTFSTHWMLMSGRYIVPYIRSVILLSVIYCKTHLLVWVGLSFIGRFDPYISRHYIWTAALLRTGFSHPLHHYI